MLLQLAVAALPLAACDANAQCQASAASADGEDYRLTMTVLRKALPVLYPPEGRTQCEQSEKEFRDPRSMSVAEMQKLIEACPPVNRAAADQGISTRELALIYKAMTLVGYRIAEEETAKLSGKTAPPLPPGALRDNVALVRQNEAELARMSGSRT